MKSKKPQGPVNPEEIVHDAFRQLYYWNVVESLIGIINNAFHKAKHYDGSFDTKARETVSKIKREIEGRLFAFVPLVKSISVKEEVDLYQLVQLDNSSREAPKLISFNGIEQDLGFMSDLGSKADVALTEEEFRTMVFLMKKAHLAKLEGEMAQYVESAEKTFSESQRLSIQNGLQMIKHMEGLMFGYLDKLFSVVATQATSPDKHERERAKPMYEMLNKARTKYRERYKLVVPENGPIEKVDTEADTEL